MAILGQIMGTSFGRSPMQGAMPVRMPQPFMPTMRPLAAAPPRMPNDTKVPYAGGAQPDGGIMDQLRQGRADFRQQGLRGPDFKSAIDELRASLGLGPHGGMGNDAGTPLPSAASTGIPPSVVPNGIMNSVMQAFNGGYGNAPLDISKLIQMAPMVMGA